MSLIIKKARRAQIRQEKFKEIHQKQLFIGPSTKRLRNKQVKSLQNEKTDVNPSLMVLSLINLISAFQKNSSPVCSKKNYFATCSKAIDYNIQFLNQKEQPLCIPDTNTSYNITQQNQTAYSLTNYVNSTDNNSTNIYNANSTDYTFKKNPIKFKPQAQSNKQNISITLENQAKQRAIIDGQKNPAKTLKDHQPIETKILQTLDFSKISKQNRQDNREWALTLSEPLCEAANEKKLSLELVQKMLSHLNQIYTSSSDAFSQSKVDMMYRGINQLNDPQVFNAFNEFVLKYKDDPNKQKEFIYNTIVFPYQRDSEGSCFATSQLIVMHANKPIEWMKFIDRIISNDEANFNYFTNSNRPELKIDVSSFGTKETVLDKVYQKAISAVASFSAPDIKSEVAENLQDICISTLNSNSTCKAVGKNLASKIVWNHQWMPVSNLTTSLKTDQQTIENLKKALQTLLPSDTDPNLILKMAENIHNGKGVSGGFTQVIMRQIQNSKNVKYEKIEGSNLVKNTTITTQGIKSLLKALEFGCNSSFTQKLKPGQAVLAKYYTEHFGHAMTFLSGHYDVDSMQIGDRVKIGHMNWLSGENEEEHFIYMKKTGNGEIELVHYDNKPITSESFKSLTIYPEYMTQYESASKTRTTLEEIFTKITNAFLPK